MLVVRSRTPSARSSSQKLSLSLNLTGAEPRGVTSYREGSIRFRDSQDGPGRAFCHAGLEMDWQELKSINLPPVCKHLKSSIVRIPVNRSPIPLDPITSGPRQISRSTLMVSSVAGNSYSPACWPQSPWTKLFYSPTTRPLPSLVTLMKVWQAEGMTAICSFKSFNRVPQWQRKVSIALVCRSEDVPLLHNLQHPDAFQRQPTPNVWRKSCQ